MWPLSFIPGKSTNVLRRTSTLQSPSFWRVLRKISQKRRKFQVTLFSLNLLYLIIYSCVPFSGGGFIASSSAFLFSLQNPERAQTIKLQINNTLRAAQSLPLQGPVFGTSDLFICDRANEGLRSFSQPGREYQLPWGIEHSTAEAINLLAGSAYFVPDDMEVFVYESECQPVNTPF